MSISSIYNFYRNKDDILSMLLENIMEECLPLLEITEENIDSPICAVTDFFMCTSARFEELGHDITRALRSNLDYSSISDSQSPNMVKSFYQLSALIDAAQKRGTLNQDSSAKDLSRYLMLLYEGAIYCWAFNLNPSKTLSETFLFLFERVIVTLKP